MKKSPATLILCLIVLTALFTAQAQTGRRRTVAPPARPHSQEVSAPASWEGTYIFQEGGGRTQGGAGMTVEHTIRVYRKDDALIADLDAAGFQTSVSLRCSTKVEGEKISLYFDSYREDNITEPYRKGQLLLTLERSSVGPTPRILTHWGAYQPALGDAKSGRVYFKRSS